MLLNNIVTIGYLIPLFSLFLLTETEKRPALFLGISSDRIGSPAGKQSYYATASKYVPALHASFYASLRHSRVKMWH